MEIYTIVYVKQEDFTRVFSANLQKYDFLKKDKEFSAVPLYNKRKDVRK